MKDVETGDSQSTMTDAQGRKQLGSEISIKGFESCSLDEARWRFLGVRGSERPFFNGHWPRRREADLFRLK